MKSKLITIVMTLLTATLLLAQADKEPVFVPYGLIKPSTFTCEQHLATVEEDTIRRDMHILWAHGYYTALHKNAEEEVQSSESHHRFYTKLVKSCKANPKKIFIDVIRELD